jgi:hypothetical protein
MSLLRVFVVVLLAGPAGAADSLPTPDSTAAQPAYRLVTDGSVAVSARLVPRRTTRPLTVGDRFKVELEVRRHRDQRVSEPMLEDERFVVLDHESVTRYEGDTIVDTHTLEMAAFAPGEIAIPGFVVAWPGDSGLLAARSDSLPLEIESVMPEGMEDVNDLKPQIPYPNLLPLWLTLGVVGLAVLGFVGWRLFRRWHRKRQEVEPLPEPWEEALAALGALPVQKWLAAGRVKRYYYAVSEIMKRYLTRRYGFPAIDQTTSEMTLALKRVRVGERDEFIAFFRRADLVKYAKLVPEPVEAAAAVSVARDLVNKTTPKEEGSRVQGFKGSSDSGTGKSPNSGSPGPSRL